jgi:anti-sigma-K factor RskA
MKHAGPDTLHISADEALALDLAHGILAEPDRGQALERLDEDAEFALLVSKYRRRLGTGSMSGGASYAAIKPPSSIWKAILAKISSQPDL